MTDLQLIETGMGGDLLIKPGANDFVQVTGYENSIYLAMFGDDGSWWGNALSANPYTCKTGPLLKAGVAMNSAGRILIENAVGEDLSFLQNIPGTTYTYSVTIDRVNGCTIAVNINGQLFSWAWNPDTLFLTYQV